jgi:hypothetical protein
MIWFRFIMILVLGLITSTACSADTIPLQNAKLAVIYTNAAKKESILALFDTKGELTADIPLKAMGIFEIEQTDQNQLILPERFGQSIITISPSGKVRTHQTKEFPIFVKKRGGVTVYAFNTQQKSNTLEIVQKSGRKQMQLAGFLRTATWDNKYIYVFSSLIEANIAVLYVINRQTGDIVKTVPLAIDLADDLKIVGRDLLITSTDEQKKMAIYDLNKGQVLYIQLPYAMPQYILTTENEIWISHKQQPVFTVLDPKTWKVKRTLSVSQPVFKVQQDTQNLYVLSQSDTANTAGLIGVYDKKDLKQKQRILLPHMGGMRIQNFALLR